MKCLRNRFSALACLTLFIAVNSLADAQTNRRRGNQNGKEDLGPNETKQQKLPDLPNDPKLFKIHKAFSDEAMKIAKAYERDRDFDAAMAVYGQVLRLIPTHVSAKEKLDTLLARQKDADRQVLKVDATKAWQPTGIRVIANKPIVIETRGKWTFTLKAELTPDGMAIPEKLKEFKLGCLVGFIDTGNTEQEKAFIVGAKKELIPKRSGVLFLQMYDTDLSDNEGAIDVAITGTFERVNPRKK